MDLQGDVNESKKYLTFRSKHAETWHEPLKYAVLAQD